MAHVALVINPGREGLHARARDLAARLASQGHEVRVPASDALDPSLRAYACAEAELGSDLDLAVSLGGDGNMLRTVRMVADDDVPVLGVNFGQLGYLTEIEPAGVDAAIAGFLAGEHRIQLRMRLEITVRGTSLVARALNEAVVEKVDSGRTVRLGVDIDGRFFTTYAADGLIVATPTGSTAYSLSARGPILDPDMRALVVTPVSPHMLFDRSLVLKPETDVTVSVLPDRYAALAVDGRIEARLEPGDAVVCRASDHPVRLVTFGERDFHSLLKTKFGLNDR